jgi:hypothetical protein
MTAAVLAVILTMVPGLAAGTSLNLFAVLLPSTRDLGRGAHVRATTASVSALALTTVALAVPFFLHGPLLAKSLVAQALVVETWRLLEILRTPHRFSRRERAARILLLPYEFTFLERTPRRWPLAELALSSAILGCGVAALVFCSRLSPPVTPYTPRGWPRWLGAAASGYVVMEGATGQWVAFLPAFGWRHRPYQRHPILSRTLAEFWGARWSSVVHRWLRTNVYEPLARVGAPRLGVVAAFGASALLHAYMVCPAAGIVPALWMLAFFLAHGVFMVVEARLSVRRWRPVAGRAFVVAVFVATVPMFMEPVLRAVGL